MRPLVKRIPALKTGPALCRLSAVVLAALMAGPAFVLQAEAAKLIQPARAPSASAAVKPNVVYLLADDLGWSDISTHPGGSIRTPSIDRLFKQGVELRNFMGWCVCSPTRAMLLTGRHPFRVGTGPEVGGELEKAETTLAEGFLANGYRTGVFGKWHNGEDPDTPEYRAAFAEAFKDMPNKKLQGGLGANAHGFDEAWVYYGGGADYFTRRTVQGRGPVSWWHNREFRPQDAGYTEDFIVQHALEFIRQNKDRPFFCYVPFHIVHSPLQAKDEDLQGVDPKVTDKTRRVYTAMVQAMDRNVGSILKELDTLGLRDNTIVVFTSDNGATKDGSNLPFRGGKHTVLEGGTRLPTVHSLAQRQGCRPQMGWFVRRAGHVPHLDGHGGFEDAACAAAGWEEHLALLARQLRQPGRELLLGVAQRKTPFAPRSGGCTAFRTMSSFTISATTWAKAITWRGRNPR